MSNKDLPRKVDLTVDSEQRVSDDFFGCKFEVKIIDKDRKPVPWHPFKLKHGEEVIIDGETNGEGIFEGEKVLNIRRYTQSKVTLILEDNPATSFVNIPTNLEREPQPDKENGPVKGINEVKWPEDAPKPVFNIDDIFTSSGRPDSTRSALQQEIIIEIRKLGLDPIKLHETALDFFEWMGMPKILGEVSFEPNLEKNYKADFGIPMDKALLQKLVADFAIARKSTGTRPDVEIQDQRLLNYGGLSLFFTKLFREGDVILEVADSPDLEEILLYANPIEIDTGTFDLEKLFTKETTLPSLVGKTEKIIKKNRKEYKGKIEIKVTPKPVLKDGHVIWDVFERNHPEFMPDLPTFLLHLNRLQEKLNSGKLNLTDSVKYTVYLNAFTEDGKVVLADVKIDQNKVRVSLRLDGAGSMLKHHGEVKDREFKKEQENQENIKWLMELVERNYSEALRTFNLIVDSKKGEPVPSKEVVKFSLATRLTKQQIGELQKLLEPILIIIPDTESERLISAINQLDCDKATGIIDHLFNDKNAYFEDFYKTTLKKIAKSFIIPPSSKKTGKCIFVICEGKCNLEADDFDAWNKNKSTSTQDRLEAFEKYYEGKGVVGLNDLAYVVLSIRKPIDCLRDQSFILLSGETKTSFVENNECWSVAYGPWVRDPYSAIYYRDYMSFKHTHRRIRACVTGEILVPESSSI